MATTAVRRPHNILEEGAQLCRLLAAVEAAHLIGEEENVDTLLSQITALECKDVARELDRLANVARDTHTERRRQYLEDVSSPRPPTIVASSAPSTELATVIPLDRHSRRI